MIAIDAIAGLVSTVVDKIWPDANIEANAKAEAIKTELTQQLQASLGQLEINKIEAGSASLFVAGWRPWVGWVCGVALAYAAIIEPIARFVSAVIFGYTGVFPVIDTEITLQILLGLLGLAGMRSYEKTRR